MGYVRSYAVITGVASALALATLSSSIASPVSTGAHALKSATSSDVIDVRWRGGRRWGYYGGGFATGLAVGALAARPYYYGYGPSYYDPYYAPPPAAYVAPPAPYAEPYADPNGPARQCWVPTDRDRGYGYYRPC